MPFVLYPFHLSLEMWWPHVGQQSRVGFRMLKGNARWPVPSLSPKTLFGQFLMCRILLRSALKVFLPHQRHIQNLPASTFAFVTIRLTHFHRQFTECAPHRIQPSLQGSSPDPSFLASTHRSSGASFPGTGFRCRPPVEQLVRTGLQSDPRPKPRSG